MNSKRLLVLMALLPMLVLFGRAQSNLGFYHVNDQYNASDFNPAFLTFQKNYTISLFPLSGFSIGYNDKAVIENMLSEFITGKLNDNALKEVSNSLVARDLFYQRMENSLLYLGYNTSIGSFNFRIKEVEQLSCNLKGDLSNYLLNKTLQDFQSVVPDQPQPFPAQVIHYREYSLGYAKEIIENKLSVGIRAKIYFGKSSVWSDVQGKVSKVNENYYLETSGNLKLSAPVDVKISNQRLEDVQLSDHFSFGDYLLNRKNMGAGFDFGLNYEITPALSLSASVIDLGRINWKSNLNNMNFVGKPVLLDPNNPSLVSAAFNETFAISIDNSNYSTPMPVTFYAGLKYQISSRASIGVVDRYIKVRGLNQNSFSVTVGYSVRKNLTLSSGYSVIGNSQNIPLGIVFNWKSGQVYLGSDNVLAYISQSGSEFSGLSAGACFYLFRGKFKDSKQFDYLPFYHTKSSKQMARK